MHYLKRTLLLVFLSCLVADLQASTITVHPDETYQVITGFEAMGWICSWDDPFQIANYQKWADQVIDGAVNEVGITRVRVEVRSGAENPVDYFTQYFNGQIPRTAFKTRWYDPINDNDDPFLIDPNGFRNFGELDHVYETIAVPLKEKVEENGEKAYINLCIVDFGTTEFQHYDDPEEYAEFMLAVFQHLEKKYGFVPDAIEIILEPANSEWNGRHIGHCILATGERLKAYGFEPDFIAPSNPGVNASINDFEMLLDIPGAVDLLTEYSYHLYWDRSDSSVQRVVHQAAIHGLNTSMLEWWDTANSHERLHKDLSLGMNSAWQTGVFCNIDASNNATAYYGVSRDDPNTVTLLNQAKFYRQYCKFIRPGALRIGTSSEFTLSPSAGGGRRRSTVQVTNEGPLDPLAFINADSNYVVVIKAESGMEFDLVGLPGGTYGITYTTGPNPWTITAYNVDLPEVTIEPDSSLSTAIPDKGVITIHQKP